jgi:mono/diheme cytochrome c family protein
LRRLDRTVNGGNAAAGDAVAMASVRLSILMAASLAFGAARAQTADPIQRGRAVFDAAGGCSCHTDFEGAGPELAGGRPIATPFGVYYATNITPDPETGIGRWSDADFVRAMREGRAPDGSAYFPVFPYPSFTAMSDEDLLALKAFLFAQPAERLESRAPEAWPPFSWRVAAEAWQWLYFAPRRFEPDPARPADWNRGAYLVEAVSHCGECHTPRTFAGALDRSRWLVGSVDGPEGETAPNLTPDDETGIGRWTREEIAFFLKDGVHPDGESTEGLMKEVVLNGFRRMPTADAMAIATYLKSLPPLRNDALAHEHEHGAHEHAHD